MNDRKELRTQWGRAATVALHFLLILTAAGCMAPQTRFASADEGAVEREREVQKRIIVETRLARELRLHRVAYPIWTAAADLCREKAHYRLWFNVLNKAQLDSDRELGAIYEQVLGVTDRPTVVSVVPGGPAERGGLLVRDVLLSANGVDLAGAKDLSAALDQMGASLTSSPVTATIERDGQVHTVTMTPVHSCNFPIVYVPDDALNAFADGRAVYVTGGMMRFTENDDELALVLGHELAHNAEGHSDAKRANAMGGLFVDILAAAVGVNTQGAFSNAAAASYSQEFESEADYVGLYAVARAGYSFAAAPNFWRRMAAEHPASVRGSYGSTHPSTPQRFTSLEQASAEIMGKVVANSQLVPERLSVEDSPKPSGNSRGPRAAATFGW